MGLAKPADIHLPSSCLPHILLPAIWHSPSLYPPLKPLSAAPALPQRCATSHSCDRRRFLPFAEQGAAPGARRL